jgi:hypothetical protein
MPGLEVQDSGAALWLRNTINIHVISSFIIS